VKKIIRALYIVAILTVLKCNSTVNFQQSVGGSVPGFYEIFLCDHTFEIVVAIFLSHDNEAIEKAIKQRIEALRIKYHYESFEIISRNYDTGPFDNFFGNNVDFLRYRVKFSGHKPNLPSLRANMNAFIYVRNSRPVTGNEPAVTGDYHWPDFLRGGERIISTRETNTKRYYPVALHLNICRNNHYTNYAIARGSIISVQNGNIIFEKGGILDCALASKEPHVFYNQETRGECKLKEIKALE